MRRTHYAAQLVLLCLFWTAAGGSSDPELTFAGLPSDVVNDCALFAAAGHCGADGYRIRWVDRTPAGDLFVVRHDRCRSDCRAWLVSRSERNAARMLLAMTGEFRIEHHGEFPTVTTRTTLDASYTQYHRFAWNGAHYARTETRVVFRIGDFECADERACEAAAREALRRNDAGRAVRIWEEVYGVSWI